MPAKHVFPNSLLPDSYDTLYFIYPLALNSPPPPRPTI